MSLLQKITLVIVFICVSELFAHFELFFLSNLTFGIGWLFVIVNIIFNYVKIIKQFSNKKNGK